MGKQSKLLILLSGLIVILLGVTYFMAQTMDPIEKQPEPIAKADHPSPSPDVEEPAAGIPEEKEIIPESKTGLMIGFDQSNNLTDVIMVGHVDTSQNKVKVISIPRDFLIDFSQEPFKSLKQAHPNIRIGHSRINGIYALTGGDEEGLAALKLVVETITGLHIDHMATIDVSGFKKVVDIVGGVEFDVPVRMYKMDPYQDPPLRINLQPGLQLLNGEQAQGLVRFRGYPNGDFQRIKVQQEFITALFQKIVSSNGDQLTALVRQISEMVKADFGLVEITEYLNYFLDKDISHVLSSSNMITLEGWNMRLDDGSAVLGFDVGKNQKLIKELLERKDQVNEEEELSTEQAAQANNSEN